MFQAILYKSIYSKLVVLGYVCSASETVFTYFLRISVTYVGFQVIWHVIWQLAVIIKFGHPTIYL
jgi:hypothetical protein